MIARRRAAHGVACAALALATAAACGESSLEVLTPPFDDAGIADGLAPFDGGVVDGGSVDDYCSGKGPPILVGDTASTCAGGLAQGIFRYALCTCEGYVSSGALTTDSFDSTGGAYDPAKAKAGGSVGTNGGINAAALDVGGTLWGSDVSGMTLNGPARAKGELHANGRVGAQQALTVARDAYVNGDLVGQSDVTIGGTLHVPAGKTVSAAGAKTIGATVTGPVSVPAACDCAAGQLVNVAGYVERYRSMNDDAALNVDARALENVGSDLTLALPCGRLFFTRVGGSAAIKLSVTGRTAIFVGGDLAPNGPFSIDVAPGGELDLFVEGNVVSGASFALGSAANPANARLYVGGDGTVNLSKAATLAGNVYAPRAELVLGSGTTTVFGSVFVRRVSAQGPITIHYDEGVLGKGDECPPAASTCTTCHDCGNQACNGGTCGACATSADCCAPFACIAGRCVPEIK